MDSKFCNLERTGWSLELDYRKALKTDIHGVNSALVIFQRKYECGILSANKVPSVDSSGKSRSRIELHVETKIWNKFVETYQNSYFRHI